MLWPCFKRGQQKIWFNNEQRRPMSLLKCDHAESSVSVLWKCDWCLEANVSHCQDEEWFHSRMRMIRWDPVTWVSSTHFHPNSVLEYHHSDISYWCIRLIVKFISWLKRDPYNRVHHNKNKTRCAVFTFVLTLLSCTSHPSHMHHAAKHRSDVNDDS